MRKIVVSEFVSLDGIMEDPGGAEKFKYGGWTIPYFTDEIAQFKYDELFASDSLLLGRVTYEGFAKAWPTMKGTGEFGEKMNGMKKYVVSTTLEKAGWNNSEIMKDAIAEQISKLKQNSEETSKDIMVFGSGILVQTLMQQSLVDLYNLLVYPVILGTGKRLFKDGSYAKLKRIGTKQFGSGVELLQYEPA